MNEIQRVVDELRFILQREVIEKSVELVDLVAAYSQLCHETNVRLRRCNECMKQGLRSEALHVADAAPNLMDVVAILDFPERDELLDLLSMYFLTPPEPLLLDVATTLNSAYAEHAPLEKLLELHRLLALGRASLRQRLSVLRLLAENDSASPHWESDIRDMEQARLAQIETASVKAAKSGDSEELRSLVAEIEDEGWRQPVPAGLVRDVKSRSSQIVRGNARQKLEKLNEQLYAAFSALDTQAARRLREEWQRERQQGRVADNDPLCEQVTPILAWLADEDQKASDEQSFSKAVGEIERALDDEDSEIAELRKLKLTIDQLGRRLPAILETRLRSRLATLDLIEGRRRKLILGSAVGVFVIVVGVFGLVVYLSMEGEKSRRLVAVVTAFIDEGKLPEAQKLIDQQAARSNSDAWLAVKKKLADAEQSEHDRIVNWKANVATARESTESVVIEDALKHARESSRTAEEKIEVGQLESAWQKRVNEAVAVREKSFRESLVSATECLKDLDHALASLDAKNSDEVAPLLAAAESKVGQLIAHQNSVAKELQSQAILLESQLKISRRTVNDNIRRSELLNQITDAVLMVPGTSKATINQGRYEAYLQEFVSDLPHDPRADRFKSALANNCLPAVLARQELIDRWRRFRPADKKDAENRLKELRAFFSMHPRTPDRELLGRYETWLASVLRRFAEDGDPDEGICQRLHTLFSSRFIKDANVLYDGDGHTFYLAKPQTANFGSIAAFTYLVGFNGETNQVTMKPEKLLTPKSIAPPQQDIAIKARSAIRNVTFEGWRDCLCDLTETLLKAEKLDPFLRYLLVLKTIEFAGNGDSLLELELAPLLKELADEEIDRSAPWMDPFSTSAETARTHARERLAKLPPVEAYFSAVAKRQEQFERELFAPRFSIGWLEKNSSGAWVCRTNWSPTTEHILYVVTQTDPSSSKQWAEVGRIRDTSRTVDAVVAQTAGEAAAVFASAANSSAETALAR